MVKGSAPKSASSAGARVRRTAAQWRRRQQSEIQAPFDFKEVCGAWFKIARPSEERKC